MNTSRSIIAISIVSILLSCTMNKTKKQATAYSKGTFGYDLQFLQSKDNVIVLKNEDSQVIVSPKYQGKVFTSTAMGPKGTSFGWINYDALNNDSIAPQINAYGGEDRLWLGPEGGQFSIFFKPGDEMDFANWQTPAELDYEPWELVEESNAAVSMKKDLQLHNYSGTNLYASLYRKVKLNFAKNLLEDLGVKEFEGLKWVGFETENKLSNIGNEAWTKESGTLCIWMLGMLNPSEDCTVIIPYKEGDEKELGPVATTNYFGEIPEDRIKIENGLLFFKADGKHRSKLGLSVQRSTSIAGSYDPINKALTIVNFNKPEDNSEYINQLWEMQDEPFVGDVINSYNDGPLEDGAQLGPFYELETSSPAAFLKPGESITHTQQIYHFQGEENDLNLISEKILGVSIDKIKSVFKK